MKEDRYLHIKIADHHILLPVIAIRDVLYTPKMTSIPLSSQEIRGLLNLRGKIVTAIDLGVLLQLRSSIQNEQTYSIIVEQDEDMYSFIIDVIGKVFDLEPSQIEPLPSTMEKKWFSVATGVVSLDQKLYLLLNVEKVFTFLKANMNA